MIVSFSQNFIDEIANAISLTSDEILSDDCDMMIMRHYISIVYKDKVYNVSWSKIKLYEQE